MAQPTTSNLTELIDQYRQLTDGVINFDFYNQMVHTHHSTAIEGSSLTLIETQTLLEKGTVAGGKPLNDHLMVVDHQRAQELMLNMASGKEPLSRARIQQLCAAVMRNTGGPRNAIMGSFDTSKGDFRTVTVMAGSRIFMDAKKVIPALDKLIEEINRAIKEVKTPQQIYDLSFQAHYQFVSIHPFGDGNGRTSRLLMNYVQHYHGLPLSLVYAQDRNAYVEALEKTRADESVKPILQLMHQQLQKFLTNEIERLSQQQKPILKPAKKGKGLSFVF